MKGKENKGVLIFLVTFSLGKGITRVSRNGVRGLILFGGEFVLNPWGNINLIRSKCVPILMELKVVLPLLNRSHP